MITITAFKWVVPFAQGQVRDLRLRWLLKEVGWDYQVDLIDPDIQQSEAYMAEQPFGQVPVLREPGRVTLFETGAILLDVAERSGRLLPEDATDRALVTCWLFGALNSIEPFLQNLAIASHFIEDQRVAEGYRAFNIENARKRLGQTADALGGRDWIVGDAFSIADLMLSSVTKLVEGTGLVEAHPNLAAWRDRCFSRDAYRQALAEQCSDFSRHGPADMGWDEALAGS